MLKRRIGQPFLMEVIILMNWAIWCGARGMTRSLTIEDPSVGNCKDKFIKEFRLLLFREKEIASTIEQWLEDIAQPP
jgi:hypothetical protein